MASHRAKGPTGLSGAVSALRRLFLLALALLRLDLRPPQRRDAAARANRLAAKHRENWIRSAWCSEVMRSPTNRSSSGDIGPACSAIARAALRLQVRGGYISDCPSTCSVAYNINVLSTVSIICTSCFPPPHSGGGCVQASGGAAGAAGHSAACPGRPFFAGRCRASCLAPLAVSHAHGLILTCSSARLRTAPDIPTETTSAAASSAAAPAQPN